MANGKSNSEIIKWYNYHIKLYKQAEDRVLAQMTPKAADALKELLKLTSEDTQNKELDEAISRIESIIDYDSVINNMNSASEIQSQIANEIIALDSELRIFGNDISGLQALAEGKYDKAITASSGKETLVSNAELNDWLIKIMKRIDVIKSKNEKKSFTGYLSNLKGAYLEAAVMKLIGNRLPVDIDIANSFDAGRVDLFNSGNIRAGKRQMAEDILIVFGDKSRQTLQEAINNPDNKSKTGRVNISVPIYREIQAQSTGISVKAGNAPIKFYEGNLNSFFSDDDNDLRAYHDNVLVRASKAITDNEKGRSVNRYLVAMHLDNAIGNNNLFLATRNNVLSSMSQKLTELRDTRQLYMTGYKIKSNSIYGRIVE